MIVKIPFRVDPLERETTLHVYVPDDYEQRDERYPVMYMYDGHNLFDDGDATYGKSWGLAAFLARYDKPFLVVEIECDHRGRNRLDEYCPYEVRSSILGEIHGKGELFMDWVVNTLKPYIDENFRTYPDREATGIAGSSMGGLMAYYSVIRYNKVFSKAACLSPSLMVCPEQLKHEIKEDWIHPDTRVYLSMGTKEFGSRHIQLFPYLDHFAQLVQPAMTKTHVVRDGEHNEASWEQLNEEYFDYLWK